MPNLLEKFEQDNPDLTEALEDDKQVLSTLLETDEVYLVRIPKTVNVKHLKGVDIPLHKKTKHFKYEDNDYDFIPDLSPQNPITILSGKNLLQTVQPAGTLKMQLHTKKKAIPVIQALENSTPEFPNNLKQRHPLFGSDYQNKVDVNGKIKVKLESNGPTENNEGVVKKKKKRKAENTGAELIEQLLGSINNQISHKKKKKKKHE